MAFSPDGKTLATIGSDLTARLWDIVTHAEIGAPFGSGVAAVAVSPDGKTLATIGNTPAFWPVLADQSPDPYQHAEARDLLEALREEIGRLTPRQRQVFVAIALSEVPIDVLADRLNTTRGALYKMLHDARHHLKAVLAARGLGSAGEWR